ncbi:MAG: 4Fe-4S binding protein, partial [Pseudomonadota bacterium]
MSQRPKILLCDCTGTFEPNPAQVSSGTGLSCSRVHSHLCQGEAAQTAAALKSGPVVIACAQEATGFSELAEDLGVEAALCVDIRDRAGWSEDESGPKMAALIADALLPTPATPVMDVATEGVCLVYGEGDQALAAGARLSATMAVTVMVTDPSDHVLPNAEMDIVTGQIRSASGALGSFALKIDRFGELPKAGRGTRAFGALRDGARSSCDVILDLSGGAALFPAPAKRDGYLRADPGDPLAIERAVFDASHLVGTFEKTLFIRVEENLCAHSRAQKTGCTRCLDLCPTSAISPVGDHITVDPAICAGCGACAAACPSGAVSIDA